MGATFLVTDTNFPASARALLDSHGATARFVPTSTDQGAIYDLLAEKKFDAVIARTVRLTAAAIAAAAPRLRVISKFGVGVDNIDVDAATAHGVVVLSTHGANAQSVAELAFLLILALRRRLLALDRSLRDGLWDRSRNVGGEIRGQRLCLVGYGSVGRAMHAIARGFGLSVSAYDPYIAPSSVPGDLQLVADLRAALAEADIVSLHCPLNGETRGMIGRAALACLKPTCLLINTARGPIVDEDSLIEHLANGRIAGAGLDTFTEEPLRPDNRLRAMANVVLTPHMGGSTAEAMQRVALQTVENAFAFLHGTGFDRLCLVNPAALERKSSAMGDRR